MEKDYEKIDKLLSLRREYSSRLKPVDASIEQESKEADEE
jgi:beta-catenin-like protein 1